MSVACKIANDQSLSTRDKLSRVKIYQNGEYTSMGNRTALLFLCVLCAISLTGCTSTNHKSRSISNNSKQRGLAVSSWPKFGGDLRNSSLCKKSTMKWEIKWTSPVLGKMDASPIIGSDGTVYTATLTGDMFSLDGKTGKVKWKSPILDNRSKSHSFCEDAIWHKQYGRIFYRTNNSASPALSADGILYIGSRDDYLYALDSATGNRYWRFRVRRSFEDESMPIISSPTIGADGTVYFIAERTCYAVNGRTGRLKWKYSRCKYSSKSFSSPVVGSDGTVYVATFLNIYAFNPQSGTVKWQFELPCMYNSSDLASGQDDTMYIAPGGERFIAINGKSGKIKWKSTIDILLTPPYRDTDNVMKSPAIGPDGTVYASTYGGYLYAWNGVTGKRMWKQKCGFRSYPVVTSDGKVYMNTCSITPEGKTQPMIRVFDGKTGKVLKKFTYDLGKVGISSPIAIAEDGTIIVDSSSGRLYAIH